MKRLLYSIALTLCFAGLVSTAFAGGKHRKSGSSFHTNSEAAGDVCADHFNVSYDDLKVFTGEEQRTLAPAAYSGGLNLRGSSNGGMLVRGWDKNEVLIKACKGVAAADAAQGKQLLEQIKLDITGSSVTATGPAQDDGQKWWVYLIVNVPRNITLSAETRNGPIALRDVTGKIQAETTNGPLKIYRCAGDITAEAQNGPISVVRSSGNIRIRTQNGPLSVELAGQEWSGQGLEASAQNGPLELKIPSNYRSGVDVVARGHSPFRCESNACGAAQKDWDDSNKSVHFGRGPTLVRLSTVNGPVSVRSTMQ